MFSAGNRGSYSPGDSPDLGQLPRLKLLKRSKYLPHGQDGYELPRGPDRPLTILFSPGGRRPGYNAQV